MCALFGLQILHHLLRFHSLLSLGREKRKQPEKRKQQTREINEPWQSTLLRTHSPPAQGEGGEGRGDEGMNEGKATQFS